MADIREEDLAGLRPIERRILKLQGGLIDGRRHSSEELAPRFLRSADHISRIAALASWKLAHPDVMINTPALQLRPIERRVLKLCDGGEGTKKHSTEDVAARFGRSPAHIQRIQHLAAWKLGRSNP